MAEVDEELRPKPLRERTTQERTRVQQAKLMARS
ncbi:MAG: hypothetical protein UU08_C0018G0019 [Candidatus Uhrbacteria bacterium GW2011_GWE2_40_58]|nr:MAG: hypothetical protein UU08_C0018G0019 [Candidatus Uhrbacteria bacterium GW2011_GWE2_40_58]